MKKLIPYIIILILAIFIGIAIKMLCTNYETIDRLETDMDLLLDSNKELVLKSNQYKIKDSLNVTQIRSLELTISELKKYREADSKLIRSLKIRNKDLESLVNTRLETRDTVLIPIKDSSKFSYTSKWTDLSGIIFKDSLQIHITNREELKVVESVKRKRFLGFLWYCKKLESRKIDVISLNPNTTITNISYIHIEQ